MFDPNKDIDDFTLAELQAAGKAMKSKGRFRVETNSVVYEENPSTFYVWVVDDKFWPTNDASTPPKEAVRYAVENKLIE